MERPDAGCRVDPVDGAGIPVGWERAWTAFERWSPHVLLAAATGMSLTANVRSVTEGAATLGLAAAAAVWVAVGHTAAPTPVHEHRPPWVAAVYLAGLLGWAALLMSRDLVFFIFAISGFLHAYVLRPPALVFVGTGATSFLILVTTWGGLPRPTVEEAGAFLAVFLLQTFLIGLGVIGGERLAETNEVRRRDVQQLQETLAENEGLQAQLVSQAREAGVLDERQRMAREIHDTLAQGLIGIITQLEAAEQSNGDEDAKRRHLQNAVVLARQNLAEARRSVHALGPGSLEHGRLEDAIEELADDWSELSGVPADVAVTGSRGPLPAAIEIGLLRVTQEALANVAKHASATRVRVSLSRLDDRVTLDVRDDGAGFDPDQVSGGQAFGLTSMRQRVADLGGTLVIESRRGDGTAVSATVPTAPSEPVDA